MSIARRAEEFVKKHFRKTRKVDLVKPNRGEKGFDFRNKDSTVFIEVKGSSTIRLADVIFLMFTNAEYKRTKGCLRHGKIYEVHLPTSIGTHWNRHYVIPGKVFVERAKPEIAWILPTNKKIILHEFLIKKEHEKI